MKRSQKYIITPTGIVIPSTEIELALPPVRHQNGKFRAWTTRPDLNNVVTQDTGWFSNLITDAGLNRLGTNFGFSAFQVGTGSTTPTVGDTTLATYRAGVASTPGAITYVGGTPYIIRQTFTAQFAVGNASGNLTEIGMSTTTTTGNLWSRALILDALLAPTTIVVQPTEALNVAYTLELSVDTTDVASAVTITGSATHTTTTRPALISSWGGPGNFMQPGSNPNGNVYAGTLGAITATPSGNQSTSTSNTAAAYSNNSLKRSCTNTWNQTNGNITGPSPIQCALFGLSGVYYQTQFNPTIDKNNTKTLVINYDVSWSR